MNPAQATEAPNGLLLTEAAFAEQRANGTFRELFSVDGLFTRLPGLGAGAELLRPAELQQR